MPSSRPTIPHSFNPKAPYDKDYPPYFYNDGHKPRWPLFRVWADYPSRLSLWLTGGHHVCPVSILFSGNARRVGNYVTPEDMTTVLQDSLYDCDWLPFEAFENDAVLDAADITLHGERYQVLVVPPTDVITLPTLAKAKAFFEQGGVVIGYGHLPSQSGTVGTTSAEIAGLRNDIWGESPKQESTACRISAAGGRSYFLPEKPDVEMIAAALHKDAGIPPVVELLNGKTDNWLHVLHRVKNGSDVFLICNQDHLRPAKTYDLTTARVVLEMEGLSPEEAARVTINGQDAGGFIGKPLRLEAGQRLKHGENIIRIEPFAPRSVRLVVMNVMPGE